MSGIQYFKMALIDRFADFSGRSRRSEYWYFALFAGVLFFMLSISFPFVALMAGDAAVISLLFFGFLCLISLALIIPSLSVTIRRLHDTGRSGWWWLISFIPVVGGIVLLIFTIEDSQPGPNQWGPNPKESAREEVLSHLRA